MSEIFADAPVRASAARRAGAEVAALPAEPAPPPPRLNAQQLEQVLQTIAGRMATLHQLIMLTNNYGFDETVRSSASEAAEIIACTLGALADEAIGADIIGNSNRWHYGPNFADAGKAGAA